MASTWGGTSWTTPVTTTTGDTIFYENETVSWRTCQLCGATFDVKVGHMCMSRQSSTKFKLTWIKDEEEEGTMNDKLRKFFTKLVARKRLTEEALEEVEAIMAYPDWEKRFLLYLLVTEKDVLLETLGYERSDEDRPNVIVAQVS